MPRAFGIKMKSRNLSGSSGGVDQSPYKMECPVSAKTLHLSTAVFTLISVNEAPNSPIPQIIYWQGVSLYGSKGQDR